MKPKAKLATEESDGELIILDKDGGEVHQLNQAAAVIWHGLSEGLGMDEIAATLSSGFAVEYERAIADVKKAVADFRELGLLDD